MMWDKENIFMDKQALSTSGTGTFLGNGTIDIWGQASIPTDALGNSLNMDHGLGDPNCRIFVAVGTAVTSGGSATVQFQLVASDDAASTVNQTVLYTTAAIAKATLVQGYMFSMGNIPPGVTQRFLGIQYIVGTAALTAGAVSAGVTRELPSGLPTL